MDFRAWYADIYGKADPRQEAYENDIKYCVVCGYDCLQDERRRLKIQKRTVYICDECYDNAKREVFDNGQIQLLQSDGGQI